VSSRESSFAGPPLAAGHRLGPYEIVCELGAGGMGEVYRARDPRLHRDVAIKVLHSSLAVTPERVLKLAKEARAAGGLNHPNIVAVFDVSSEGPRPYIVSELLEGESLRRRLDRGPLPYRKALEYGIQIAQALGAAHEKGVFHRDVKPANVFITTDDRVKLLDFGLVKLRNPSDKLESQESTADETQPGAVHGTLGYMSPEQALGEAVDHRTDIFALGAVLYEMLAGVPAFRRGSNYETIRAVLSEEPVDPRERNPSLPEAAAVLVRRCLEKSREARFQSARDLAFHLQQLKDVPSGARLPLARRAYTRLRPGLAVLGVLAAIAAAAVLTSRLPQPTAGFDQLTFRRGRIGGARFASPAGSVVYSEARDGAAPDVWWLSGPDSPQSRLLGHRGADVLAAHGGKLALSMRRRFLFGERFVGTLAEAPLGEGSPHELAENVEDADWHPSASQLAVVRSSSGGGDSWLEYPLGRVLYKASGSIRSPRFSPDGRRIAFIQDPTGRGAGGRVSVVDLDGRATPLTNDWASARGLAWARRDEIWFAAGPARMSRALRAVDLDGRERLVLETPASLTLWDIAADGRLLVTRDEERSALIGVPPGETSERDLSWFDTSALADLSDDGRTLLFTDRDGLYIRRTDGSPPVHLGLKDGFGDELSPDGKRVLATTASGEQLVILPAGPGAPVALENHGITAHRGAMWFPDGRRILFNGSAPGRGARSYVQDLDGGAPRALTPEETWVVCLSPDGKLAAAIGQSAGVWLWPLEGAGSPRRIPATQPGDRPVGWSADGRWLWLFRRGEVPAEVSQLEIATGQRRVWKRLQPPDASGIYSINQFKVTPDGRSYFYSYKRVLSQLYVAKGLR
jgi:tRNA A-37 threonylcarbamoyl transferase component Bud32